MSTVCGWFVCPLSSQLPTVSARAQEHCRRTIFPILMLLVSCRTSTADLCPQKLVIAPFPQVTLSGDLTRSIPSCVADKIPHSDFFKNTTAQKDEDCIGGQAQTRPQQVGHPPQWFCLHKAVVVSFSSHSLCSCSRCCSITPWH